jgi:hypothetical protein
LRGGVGGFDFTRVSWVLKMGKEFGRIHKQIVNATVALSAWCENFSSKLSA